MTKDELKELFAVWLVTNHRIKPQSGDIAIDELIECLNQNYHAKPSKVDWSKMPVDTVVCTSAGDLRHFAGVFGPELMKVFAYGASSLTALPHEIISLPIKPIKLAPNQPWRPWFGGECPVDPDIWVEVRFRSNIIGKQMPFLARDYNWAHDQENNNIMDYRILTVEEAQELRNA
jgi:hypothetical protein